ncbi:hypothetical protein NE237_016260 [Protea cynaroides]|uniref:Uncharacterized protein n=1 Tax=Protea cynaroides TaxID=273540 RepID=A0A9Q0KFL6_9MAGN|nr:hypothetical protein NE237_016260 [Protea cynaroides]
MKSSIVLMTKSSDLKVAVEVEEVIVGRVFRVWESVKENISTRTLGNFHGWSLRVNVNGVYVVWELASFSPNDDLTMGNHPIGSWKAPKDPKEAEANLGKLRRDYAKQVKELRKQYIYEMELQKQEKQLKDEAKREAIRIAREERKAAKDGMAQARAAEWKVLEEEFRQTLCSHVGRIAVR